VCTHRVSKEQVEMSDVIDCDWVDCLYNMRERWVESYHHLEVAQQSFSSSQMVFSSSVT